MNFTTNPGDKGRTNTLAQKNISKGSDIIECQGQIDELSAQIANLRLKILQSKKKNSLISNTPDFLLWLLKINFIIGTEVSNISDVGSLKKLTKEHLETLTKESLTLEKSFDLPKSFILTATTLLSSECNLVRTKTRSVERTFTRLKDRNEDFKLENILIYLNDLGTYFFLLSRKLEDSEFFTINTIELKTL